MTLDLARWLYCESDSSNLRGSTKQFVAGPCNQNFFPVSSLREACNELCTSNITGYGSWWDNPKPGTDLGPSYESNSLDLRSSTTFQSASALVQCAYSVRMGIGKGRALPGYFVEALRGGASR
jgi:hypothetical protein